MGQWVAWGDGPLVTQECSRYCHMVTSITTVTELFTICWSFLHGGTQLGRKEGVFVNGSCLNRLLNKLRNQINALKLEDTPKAPCLCSRCDVETSHKWTFWQLCCFEGTLWGTTLEIAIAWCVELDLGPRTFVMFHSSLSHSPSLQKYELQYKTGRLFKLYCVKSRIYWIIKKAQDKKYTCAVVLVAQ